MGKRMSPLLSLMFLKDKKIKLLVWGLLVCDHHQFPKREPRNETEVKSFFLEKVNSVLFSKAKTFSRWKENAHGRERCTGVSRPPVTEPQMPVINLSIYTINNCT